MLFNQCVASRCVLQIFDLKSWVKCNYNCCFIQSAH